jgi:hypothetical protein
MIAALLFALVERSVTPGAKGANRLDVDAAVLSTAVPLRYGVSGDGGKRSFHFDGGLEDLRLRDASGSEHPYLLIAPPDRRPSWRIATLRPIAASKTSSGFEADLGAIENVDRIRLDGIVPPMMKRLRLEGSGDRQRWTMLAAEATVFDLPDQQLRNVEVAFHPGAFRYFRVTWDDRSSARIGRVGEVALQLHDSDAMPIARELPVAFRRTPSETGKSRYRLSLPGPHLPVVAIRFEVSNPNVFRDATVSEGRLAGSTVEPFVLGSGKLRRAERAGGVAQEMTVPISFPHTADLDAVVDDASNPALTISSVVAVLAPLPWIYFESVDGASLKGTYGDRTARPPRYDLEARRSALPATAAAARWSPIATNVPPPENGSIAPIAGSAVDRKQFRYARSIASAPSGLTSLLLDTDVLARSNMLRDVRITTADHRQVPYLVERRDAPLTFPLRVPARTRGEGTHSVYAFELPYDTLPEGTRLAITTNARVFERPVTVARAADERKGREREVIATETWRSADPESGPPPLILTAPLRGSRTLELDLDEGDNAPLTITGAQLLLPSYALRFVSPGGPLTLLYGNASAEAPRYDLAILAPRLFAEPARDLSLMQAAPMVVTPESTMERRVFWIVIAGAVIALLITLGRLLSNTSGLGSEPSPRERGEGQNRA